VARDDCQVFRGGPQAVSEEKALQKVLSDIERMKNTPMHLDKTVL
jgi:hypothetical protein